MKRLRGPPRGGDHLYPARYSGIRLVDTAALTALVEPEATALGFDLVRVRVFGVGEDRTLQIMAERPDTRQLTIEDCADLSRRISDVLDREDPIEGAYRLEVSSPGIDRPLTRMKDYADWAGHEARLTLAEPVDGQKHFKGVIEGIDPEGIVAVHARNGANAYLPFDTIIDAKLVITDRLLAATAPLSSGDADEFEEETSEDVEIEETR